MIGTGAGNFQFVQQLPPMCSGRPAGATASCHAAAARATNSPGPGATHPGQSIQGIRHLWMPAEPRGLKCPKKSFPGEKEYLSITTE